MKREDGIVRGEEQSVSVASRHVLDLSVSLAFILFKGQGTSGEVGLNAATCGGRNGLRRANALGGRDRMPTGRRKGEQCYGNDG